MYCEQKKSNHHTIQPYIKLIFKLILNQQKIFNKTGEYGAQLYIVSLRKVSFYNTVIFTIYDFTDWNQI